MRVFRDRKGWPSGDLDGPPTVSIDVDDETESENAPGSSFDQVGASEASNPQTMADVQPDVPDPPTEALPENQPIEPEEPEDLPAGGEEEEEEPAEEADPTDSMTLEEKQRIWKAQEEYRNLQADLQTLQERRRVFSGWPQRRKQDAAIAKLESQLADKEKEMSIPAITARMKEQRAEMATARAEVNWQFTKDVVAAWADAATSVIPVISDVRDAAEAATGVTATGEQLSKSERDAKAAGLVVGWIPFVKLFKKARKLFKRADKTADATKTVEKIAPNNFAGMSNNALNKTINAEQHVLLRQLFKVENATGLTRASLEAAAELSRRAIANPATSVAQVQIHLQRLQQIAQALKNL